jgi:hypothetical protein
MPNVGNNEMVDLISSAAVEVAETPNAKAWTELLVILSRVPWTTPESQHGLRSDVWKVRKALKKQLTAIAGLSEVERRALAREIAKSILPSERADGDADDFGIFRAA